MIVRHLGELGAHARGRTLAVALGAEAGEAPAHGVALAFGKEAQQHPDRLAAWTGWAAEPGRLLILLPPFVAGENPAPARWEARRTDPLAGGESALGRALARDRQTELRGDLLPLERVGGQVVTAAWRKHPAAGLIVITALPLWSLLALDHQETLRLWVAELLAQAGEPRVEAPDAPLQPEPFTPTPDDWTMLLHLCTGPYADTAAALTALGRSAVLKLEPASADAALERLTQAGWASGGALAEAGARALAASPFAHHAAALRRMRRV